MTELILNSAPAPELLTGLSSGAPTTARPGFSTPVNGDAPANPFADLLSGFLQGTQPPARPEVPPVPDFSLAPAPDERPDSGTDQLALLGLPGSTAPPPAMPGTSTVVGNSTGKALPATGNPLPTELAVPRDSAVEPRTADADATPVAGTSAATEGRPRISLADLALSRPIEAAPASATAVDRATADPAAVAHAGRPLPQRGTRTHSPASTAESLPALSATQVLTQKVDAAPLTIGADELAQRLATTAFLPGTELVTGQFSSFAPGNDGGHASTGVALLTGPPTGPAGSDTTSAALLSRLGSTTLPALQPLVSNQSFAGGLADRLLTLGGPGAHSARLQLHPEHLGELNVEIQIDDGSAQVWFGTTTSQARDAIEASLPRLKELFADQGLALTRAQVDSGSSQMGNPGSDQRQPLPTGRPFEADLHGRTAARRGSPSIAGLLPPTVQSTRLVDVWA